MSIQRKFFNYRDAFLNAADFITSRMTSEAYTRMAEMCDRESILREYKTILISMGRQTGKTTALIQMAQELDNSAIIVMNPANKRWVKERLNHHMARNLHVLTMYEFAAMVRDNFKFKYIMVDEAEYTIKNDHARKELYQWAAFAGAEFVFMT